MLPSISLSSSSSSPYPPKTLNPHHFHPSSHHPPSYLKFRTTRHENLQYLKAIGLIDPNTNPRRLPSPDAISNILTTIDYFKSKGFSDPDFARLASVTPQLFYHDFDLTDIEPVFRFLEADLHANVQESRGFIVKCPQLLFSDVELYLLPTLDYLRDLNMKKLNVPSYVNAQLLNIRTKKLRKKVRFLRSLGLSQEEVEGICARFPAVFGYSIDNNLRPKAQYLLHQMRRSLEELKEFPQYFAFSLEGRIVPRHLHLKDRNVKIKLNRMLLWSDEKFYAKWK